MDDFDLNQTEDNTSGKCIICNWPINRRITEEKSKRFIKGIKEWLKKNSNEETFYEIENKLEFFKREMSICRYDFFRMIKGIIESKDKKLGKKFEIFLKAFDFKGSLVS